MIHLLEHLRSAGVSIHLSINGWGQLPVADAESCRRLVQLIDRLEMIESARLGMRELDDGKGLTFDEFEERMRNTHGVSP